MRKRIAAGVVGVAALVLSPFAACGPSFSFGAKEMTAAIEGTWKMTLPAQGEAPAQEITMKIEQHSVDVDSSTGFIKSAAACGERSLVKVAGACLDSTRMRLDVTFLTTAPLEGETYKDIHGALVVAGENFKMGMLDIQLDKRVIAATVSPDGTAADAILLRGVGEGQPMERTSVALVRIAK